MHDIPPRFVPARPVAPARTRRAAGTHRFRRGILPLEFLVEPLVEEGRIGAIRIEGGRASGKSTAIRHLQALFMGYPLVRFRDEADPGEVEILASKTPVIFASLKRYPRDLVATIHLAGWGDDEAIEHLLAAHKPRCD